MRPIAAFLLIFALADPVEAQEDSFKRWSEFYRTIRTDIRGDDVRQQLAAVEKFHDQDYPEAAEYLVELIERRKPSNLVARKAAETLGAFENEEVRELVAEKVRRSPSESRYLLLAYLAHDHPDAGAVALAAMKAARSPATATIAIEAVGRFPDQTPETVTALIEWVKPENYHTVRTAAARSLGKIPSKESILPLIESLGDLQLAETARDALLRLTGEDHWTDAEAWRTWWTARGGTFEPSPLSDEDFLKRRTALLEKHGDGAGGGMAAEFYGKKLTGKNILFLLDSSGSMTTDDRMNRLKQELGFMIDQMGEAYQFGLIMFPLDTFPARGIEPAEKRMKDRATRFIERLRPGGGTPMGEAIRFAFEKVVPKENVDTIYLLSDGVPTDVVPDQFQDVVLEFNEPLGVAIHTIWVGGEGRELLQKIAEQNGGQFWEAP